MTADPVLVRRILTETGVDQSIPAPSWAGYFQGLAEAFTQWLENSWPGLGGLSGLVEVLGPVAAVAVGVFVLVALAALLRAVFLRVRARRAPPAAAPASVTESPGSPERDRTGWRAEVDRRLAAGDVSGALEALWWWFARSVSADAVDPSWTSRELLARSGRRDLLSFARVLDTLIYGPAHPREADVRRFLDQAEAALP